MVTHLDRLEKWELCTTWGQSFSDLILDGHPVSLLEPTFDRQCQLTSSMWQLDQGAFDIERVSRDELVARAAWETGTTVMARSFGPTRADKVWSA